MPLHLIQKATNGTHTTLTAFWATYNGLSLTSVGKFWDKKTLTVRLKRNFILRSKIINRPVGKMLIRVCLLLALSGWHNEWKQDVYCCQSWSSLPMSLKAQFPTKQISLLGIYTDIWWNEILGVDTTKGTQKLMRDECNSLHSQ